MVEGMIGKKIGMTQTFDENGNVIPVTVIKAGPCRIVQIKTREKDGYDAVQLGLEDEKERKLTKPAAGHLKKAEMPSSALLREFRRSENDELVEGAQILVDIFAPGDKVDIVGTSKGKGFAGVIKRWGFKGGKKTHGSMFHRAPGSIGQSAYPSHVFKGRKMPGQMGDKRATAKKLQVIQADKEKNLLVVKGSVPGGKNGFVLVKKVNFKVDAEKPASAQEE
ncbi:MAG: 50S ribosomal protein L3 [Acidobacteria bacterium]|nr:50S ribosomal protein L3 [Acidobacteriota bacterium]MCG2816911.1 50S ribosomal protein L3 [Candidatus Aminicenantes bacterium]MBU1474253.1 50S ribosomal protein L3 [Acidobacteriota bacterium]MBU4255276.1 50S ribosomal protein L3 [Acidobacteriota bacterium]MBU4329459.1 50S ribosomal protein L3 [Acidobacteriota bacterium]